MRTTILAVAVSAAMIGPAHSDDVFAKISGTIDGRAAFASSRCGFKPFHSAEIRKDIAKDSANPAFHDAKAKAIAELEAEPKAAACDRLREFDRRERANAKAR